MLHPFRSLITLRSVIAVTALAVIAGIVFVQFANGNINPAATRNVLAQLGGWAPVALIAVLAGVLVVPIIPASVFQISAGLLFGPFLGLVCVLIADALGASVGFWLARAWGKSFLARWLSPATQTKLENLTQRITWRGVILLRLLPGPTYPLVSLAAGHSPMSYEQYLLASLLGVFPGLAVLVLAGDIAEQSPFLAFALVALLIGGLVVASRLIDRQPPDEKKAGPQ